MIATSFVMSEEYSNGNHYSIAVSTGSRSARVDEVAQAFRGVDVRAGRLDTFGERAIGGSDADLRGIGVSPHQSDDFVVGRVRRPCRRVRHRDHGRFDGW